jgi:hypothetical protein
MRRGAIFAYASIGNFAHSFVTSAQIDRSVEAQDFWILAHERLGGNDWGPSEEKRAIGRSVVLLSAMLVPGSE